MNPLLSDQLLNNPFQSVSSMRNELDAIRGDWLWFIVLGVTLFSLGGVAMSAMGIASIATAVAIGMLIFAGGVAETLGSFWCRGWTGFFLHLLSGILSIVIGLMFLRAPVGALVALTMLVASLLIVGGTFKIVTAASFRFESWGWPLANGVIDVILGMMIWQDLPASSFWVIGLFVGISLVFRGFNWIGLGIALKALAPLACEKPSAFSEAYAPSAP